MDIESIWAYCLAKPHTEESFPFNSETLVLKVGSKIFTLFSIESFSGLNLKCDPERSIELRENYSGIIPAFHMNKKHWNTVKIDEDVDDKLMYELIDHSYSLVYNSLSKKIRDGFKA